MPSISDPEQERIAYLRQHASTDAERTELAIYEAEGKADALVPVQSERPSLARYVPSIAALGVGALILLTWEPVVACFFFGLGLASLRSPDNDDTWSLKVTKREWRTTTEDER